MKRKYLSTNFSSLNMEEKWLEAVQNANTVNRLRLLFYLFDKNIIWEKTKLQERCQICQLDDKNRNLQNQYESVFKQKCNECGVVYHLSCVLAEKQKRIEKDLNNNEIIDPDAQENIIDVYYNRGTSMVCYKCEQKIRLERFEIMKAQIERTEESSRLNSISISTHSLRLNKTRLNQ